MNKYLKAWLRAVLIVSVVIGVLLAILIPIVTGHVFIAAIVTALALTVGIAWADVNNLL